MSDNSEMNPREAAAIEERNKGILESVEKMKIPGRGFEDNLDIAGLEPQSFEKKEDQRPGGIIYKNEKGQVVLGEYISYERIPVEGGKKGEEQNTDTVKGISQVHNLTFNERNQALTEEGHDLHRIHNWEKSYIYDDQGRETANEGRVTEGVEKGANWKETITREQAGDVTIVQRTNIGEEVKKEKLLPFRTEKMTLYYKGKYFSHRSRKYGGENRDQYMQEEDTDNFIEDVVPTDYELPKMKE